MTMRRCVWSAGVLVVLCVGMSPSGLEAQEAGASLAEPRVPEVPEVLEGQALEPEALGPEAQHVELSFGLAPSLGLAGGLAGLSGAGGLGGLGTAQGLGLLPVAADVAFPLGSRALVAVGASVAYADSGLRLLHVQIPISLLVYLDRPRASAFVSSVRGLVRGSTTQLESEGSSQGSFAAGAGLLGGLTYFFDDALAVRGEVGVGADAMWAPGIVAFDLHLQGSITLVLRV